MMIPSASIIFSIHSLTKSLSMTHRLSLFSKHFMQAVQPWTCFPPIWIISVVIPSFSSSPHTVSKSTRVFPSFLGLPLNATTFIVYLRPGSGHSCNPYISCRNDSDKPHHLPDPSSCLWRNQLQVLNFDLQ